MQVEVAEQAGKWLRQARERLALRYRDVGRASSEIATQRANPEYHIGLSRLADIEHRGTVPSIYRLYSLAAIYKMEYRSLLRWYGIDLDHLLADSAGVELGKTAMLDSEGPATTPVPQVSSDFDTGKTVYLSRVIRGWGKLPAILAAGIPPTRIRYAYIGLEDRFMDPLIRPGSVVQIDPRKRRILGSGWKTAWDRPIYLIEHRNGFRCAWCTRNREQTILQPHPNSAEAAEAYHNHDVEVVGQVVAAAVRLGPETRRRTRSEAVLK
jgi:transcriptional regulator with XRE-family HTH domain